jgi:hypothetical protein
MKKMPFNSKTFFIFLFEKVGLGIQNVTDPQNGLQTFLNHTDTLSVMTAIQQH